MSDVDPLTQVHEAFWRMLEGSEDFCKAVKPNNRIKMPAAYGGPEKEKRTDDDYPQVRVILVSLEATIGRTSSSSQLVANWEIQVSTIDQRITSSLFPLLWVIYRAMVNWASHFASVDWEEVMTTLLCRPNVAAIGQSELGLTENKLGWSCVWSGSTDMYFQTSAL